jgi:hypothetical protein
LKHRSNPLHPVKLLFTPPRRRYQFLCSRRADLVSLISEMEKNRRLQAAPWQIESLRRTLHRLEEQLVESLRSVRRERPLQYLQGKTRHMGQA